MAVRRSDSIKRYVARKDREYAKVLAKDLERAFRELQIESEKDLERVVRTAEKRLKATAPVDTGELRRSIKAVDGRDDRGYHVTLSVGPFYSSFIEYGTLHIPPQPFFRPAVAFAVHDFQRRR